MHPTRRALLAALPTTVAAETLPPDRRAAILEELRAAVRADPTLLDEARSALETEAERAREAAVGALIREHAAALRDDPADPVLGNPRGATVIVEFSDPRCGFCKAHHPVRQALLRRRPDVRVAMKDLAVLGPASVLAARALLAAHRQGGYAALQDALSALREEPVEAVLRREAERAGLDWPRLRRELDDPGLGRRLDGNLRLAQRLGVEGTPTLVIGSELAAGAVDLATLERRIAAAGGG